MHPELLTKALLQRAQDAGGSLQLGSVVGLAAEGGRVTAARVRDRDSGEERDVPADAIVFAMGEGCSWGVGAQQEAPRTGDLWLPRPWKRLVRGARCTGLAAIL